MKKETNGKTNMKAGLQRIISATGVILIACAVMTAFFTPTGTAADNGDRSETAPSANESADEAQSDGTNYIIKSLNGYVAVYEEGGGEPLYVTDSLVSSLPKADAAYLENGVEVHGSTALAKALEDYCS